MFWYAFEITDLYIQFIHSSIYRKHDLCTCFSVIVGSAIHILDVAAKLDQTADFMCKPKWGELPFPPPFGREAYPEVFLNFKLQDIRKLEGAAFC